MRSVVAVLVGGMLAAATLAQVPNKLDRRYNLDVDQDNFPQKTPKQALESLIKAIELKKVHYVVAQMADPAWVDQRVKEVHGGDFASLVKEVSTHLIDDPDTLPALRRFLKEGEWQEEGNKVSAKLKNSREQVFMQKLEERWFLENRKKGEKPAKDDK